MTRANGRERGSKSSIRALPLRELDAGSPLDWFDDDLSNNAGGSLGWHAYNSEEYPTDIGNPFTHDGFVASFTRPTVVGISSVHSSGRLEAILVDPQGVWMLQVPEQALISAFDARGRLVRPQQATVAGQQRLDLRSEAHGVYFVQCLTGSGSKRTAKLLKE